MFSIAPYVIQLLDEQRQPIDLWKFHGNNSLRSVLIDYYTRQYNQYTTFQTNRIFRVARLFEASPHTLAGVYQTGEYGYSGNLYDTKQKKVTHQKRTTEADMIPFQFLYITPKSDLENLRKKGILLLARHKTFGVRTITIPHLKLYIEQRFPGIVFEVKRLMPAALARLMLEKGQLQAIRLIKYKMPQTLEGLLDEEDKEAFQDIEIVVKARRNQHFTSYEKFMNLLEGKGSFRGLYAIGDLSCDNVKLDIEVGGRRRTINIGKKLVKSDIEITDDVEVDSSGYPTNLSWFKHIDELAAQLLSEIGIDIKMKTSLQELKAKEAN